MIQDLYHWTIAWAASSQAEWALFLIAFAESSFFPLPPDLLLMAMAVAAPKQSFFFALVCTVGSLLGAFFVYGIGRFGGAPLLHKVFKKEKDLEWLAIIKYMQALEGEEENNVRAVYWFEGGGRALSAVAGL